MMTEHESSSVCLIPVPFQVFIPMERLLQVPSTSRAAMNVPILMIRSLVIILLLGLGTLHLGGCDSGYSGSSTSSSDSQPAHLKRGWPKIGTLSPPFQLVDLEGNRLALSDYLGKVVVLNFWATWCGPCRVEMPAMEQLHQDLEKEGLVVLAVSVDAQGIVVTRPFQEALGLTFSILHDSDYQVGAAYGARTLPMTYLLDREGIIRHRIFGARDWNGKEARKLIRSLLEASKT